MRSAPRYADAIYVHAQSASLKTQHPILEFGAGDGVFVERFLRDSNSVDCVEPDLANQKRLRLLTRTVVSGIEELPNKQYDFIYSINVLEHLDKLEFYLKELHRVLSPDGMLFVFVPAFNILWTSLDTEVAHVQRFTRQTLVAELEAAGFKIESVRYFDLSASWQRFQLEF